MLSISMHHFSRLWRPRHHRHLFLADVPRPSFTYLCPPGFPLAFWGTPKHPKGVASFVRVVSPCSGALNQKSRAVHLTIPPPSPPAGVCPRTRPKHPPCNSLIKRGMVVIHEDTRVGTRFHSAGLVMADCPAPKIGSDVVTQRGGAESQGGGGGG